MTNQPLTPHPRLYASAAALSRLAQPPTLAFLQAAQQSVAERAERYLETTNFDYPVHSHNSDLERARRMQVRVVTLLVRWRQTGDARFRQAAVAHIFSMDTWDFWGWDARRLGDARPEADFDLSYGENSTTLAIAFDWLAETLSDEERQTFIDIAQRRALQPFLHQTRPEKRRWWFGKPDTNWNTVCAGGAGMLALALAKHIENADEILARAEESIAPYMQSLEATRGGWPEGTGYWGYGHRYAFMYLLSWENAFAKPHPLLELPGARQTLAFPLDFCPNRQPCSFGDVNSWGPMPFHYAAAERLKYPEVIAALDAHLEGRQFGEETSWPHAAEFLLFHPRSEMQELAYETTVSRLYPAMDWAVLADRLPCPQFYLAIRGGSTDVPHSHLDLLSFHCVVGAEQLISNISPGEYMDTTFSPRRFEIYETTPQSKNTILINGVGIEEHAQAKTTQTTVGGFPAIHLDATEAMGVSRDNVPAARFCARLFVLLANGALIVDRVELPFPGRVESRLHSFATVEINGDNTAQIHGKQEQLSLSFVSTVPSVLATAVDAFSRPGRTANMLRWCTQERTHTSVTTATLLQPGTETATVELTKTAEEITVRLPNETVFRLNLRLREEIPLRSQ